MGCSDCGKPEAMNTDSPHPSDTKPPDSPPLPLPIRIVLVRPCGAGNIGSVARVMRNFGLGVLYLVSPRVDHLGLEARAMACSAAALLEGACVVDTLPAALQECRWVCGTTARVGERRRAELTARTAARQAAQLLPAAFVFGPEDSGLSGEELNPCHAVVSIPTAPELRSLNLAQSVGIVAYELWNALGMTNEGEEALGRGRPDRPDRVPARAEEIEQALEHLRRTLDAVGYFRQSVPEHPLREFRRFLARAHPTRYELAMLRGMCRKTLNALRRKPGGFGDEESGGGRQGGY